MMTAISAKLLAWSASGLVALATAASAALAGDITVRAGGVEVTLGTEADRGLTVRIEGAECPGPGCPDFGLDWSALHNKG